MSEQVISYDEFEKIVYNRLTEGEHSQNWYERVDDCFSCGDGGDICKMYYPSYVHGTDDFDRVVYLAVHNISMLS